MYFEFKHWLAAGLGTLDTSKICTDPWMLGPASFWQLLKAVDISCVLQCKMRFDLCFTMQNAHVSLEW